MGQQWSLIRLKRKKEKRKEGKKQRNAEMRRIESKY